MKKKELNVKAKVSFLFVYLFIFGVCAQVWEIPQTHVTPKKVNTYFNGPYLG